MEYLRVARIVKPIGLNGELKIFSTTTFPEIRYKKGNCLYILINGEYKKVTVKEHRIKDSKFDCIKFEELNDLTSVENLNNLDIFAIKDESILDDKTYYFNDLKNLNVYDENKKEIGITSDIEEFPAQITFKIKGLNDKFFYVPFNDFFVKEINIKESYIVIHVIEGLLWNL